jgi:hypothetical protein
MAATSICFYSLSGMSDTPVLRRRAFSCQWRSGCGSVRMMTTSRGLTMPSMKLWKGIPDGLRPDSHTMPMVHCGPHTGPPNCRFILVAGRSQLTTR